MTQTEETQMYINRNTGGNGGNKTGAATFTVITSPIRKINRYFWFDVHRSMHHNIFL
jgi:hypothetical protein